MARPERFELPTSWFVATHSIQLSYGRILMPLGKTSLACDLTRSTGTQILHRYVIQIHSWMAERVGFEPTMEL